MNVGTRVMLTLMGAGFGALLLGPTAHLLGGLLGGLVALGATEFKLLHARLHAVDEELERLREDLTRREAAPKTAASAPTDPRPWRELEEPRDEERVVRDEPPAAPPPPPRPPPTQPPTQPRVPVPPYAASPTELAPIRWLIEFLTGGNTVVRVGAIILFFGVAFLLRYLAEHSHLPIEWRLSGIVLGGVALLVVGWRLRTSRRGYALALQGVGVGILYLTVFAALRLYALLPAAIAFPILAVVAVSSALLAVLQDALSLALLGVIGGFLAPVLASTGEGSPVVLFSYYALLDAGILAMAWFKAWRPLNVVGFVFTFGVATVWGVLRYRPEAFASIEPFLVLYFLFYLSIAVLFTLRQPPQLKGYIDGTLVFGTPIAVFLLQSVLLQDRPMPLAYSAVAMSACYLLGAGLLKRRRREPDGLLLEAFLAIGVTLLTMAVPLACDARWNVAAWAVEGTALIWVGCRQQRLLARLGGYLLILACGLIAGMQFDLTRGVALLPLADFAGFVLLSLASILAACIVHRYAQVLRAFERPSATALFWWGLWWWSASGLSEIVQRWPVQELTGALLLLSFTTVACSILYRWTARRGAASERAPFAAPQVAALLQLPGMLWVALLAVAAQSHPASGAGWLGWPLAFATLVGLMARHEGPARQALANALHAGASWLLCALASWELVFQIDRVVAGGDAWATPGWVLLPLVLLAVLPRLVARVPWPYAQHRDAYLFLVGVGIALYLYAWSVFTNLGATGDVAPLPYYPLLNPLDLTQAIVLLILLRYWRFLHAVRSAGFLRIDRRVPIPALAALTFLWLNAALLRTLHQWFQVPYGLDALLDSTLVQTSLSIFWALLAFALMLVAARRRQRTVWVVGASLLGVVIAKLFLVDLSRVGSIERIVSFVGVGLVMLLIGYVSPLPPPRAAE
jgi:uncharacterized membrane protein